eukprot:TRINITY_DN1442_c0_g1_i1.p2 TRINITY_DN1442_c0_g1~~TRINITY_DN1442_c0_g1_i1.p2  ORF type:complete len:235 (+),score=58.56 TRINITY_DN1442_c0_g1_i1:55-759(+)
MSLAITPCALRMGADFACEKLRARAELKRCGVSPGNKWECLDRALKTRDVHTLGMMRQAWGLWLLYELLPSDDLYESSCDGEDEDEDEDDFTCNSPLYSEEDDTTSDAREEDAELSYLAKVQLLAAAGYSSAVLARVVFESVLDFPELHDAALHLLGTHRHAVADDAVLAALPGLVSLASADAPDAHHRLTLALARCAAAMHTPAASRVLTTCRGLSALPQPLSRDLGEVLNGH